METIRLIAHLAGKIGRPLNIMEVCGTHTVAIFKSGIKSILPENISLLSGPGCPVCVTSVEDIDRAIAYAIKEGQILATFGDMMRVPGSRLSLLQAKAEGAHIEVVYSPMDCIRLAQGYSDKRVIFFAAGFETTAPLAAATLYEAERLGVKNLLFYSVHKLVPPALKVLLDSEDVKIDGFILPGHVSAIIGSGPYQFIPTQYGVPCVISGFKADEILTSIYMLLKQIYDRRPAVEIQYASVVRPEGNEKALEFIERFFDASDSYWRGIGLLKASGLRLKGEWSHRDSEKAIPLKVESLPEPKGCQCGLVLRGIKSPPQCPLFAKTCTPQRPVGACMGSSEGSCAAYYKYSLPNSDKS